MFDVSAHRIVRRPAVKNMASLFTGSPFSTAPNARRARAFLPDQGVIHPP